MELSLEQIEGVRPYMHFSITNRWIYFCGPLPKKNWGAIYHDPNKYKLWKKKLIRYAEINYKKYFRPAYFSTKRIPDNIWEKIPKEGGVYVLYEAGQPIYIGISESSIYNRITAHVRKFIFDGITAASIFEITEIIPQLCYRDLLELEKKLIKNWEPKYNIVHRRYNDTLS